MSIISSLLCFIPSATNLNSYCFVCWLATHVEGLSVDNLKKAQACSDSSGSHDFDTKNKVPGYKPFNVHGGSTILSSRFADHHLEVSYIFKFHEAINFNYPRRIINWNSDFHGCSTNSTPTIQWFSQHLIGTSFRSWRGVSDIVIFVNGFPVVALRLVWDLWGFY